MNKIMIEANSTIVNFISKTTVALITFSVCFIYLVIPSINITSFANFDESSRTIFLLFSSIPLLLLISLYLLISGNTKFKLTSLDILLTIFFLYISLNRYVFQENITFSIRYFDLLGMCILYLSIRIIPQQQYGYIFVAILLGALLQTTLGLLQYVSILSSANKYFPITGSFSNPGPYAGYLAMVGIFSIALIIFKNRILPWAFSTKRNNTWGSQILYFLPFATLALIIVLLPALRSRAAWIALAAGLLICCSFQYNPRAWFQKLKKSYKLIVANSLLVLTVFFGFLLFSLKSDSAAGRLLIYKVTTGIINNNMINGVGFDRFKVFYMDYQADHLASQQSIALNILADNTVYAFNEPLQTFAESGFIGGILWLAIIYVCFRIQVPQEYRFLKQLIISLFVGLLVFGFFTYTSSILPIKIFFPYCFAILASIGPALHSSGSHSFVKSTKIAVSCIAITLTFFLFQYTLKLKQGFEIWGNGLALYSTRFYGNSATVLKKTYPLFAENGEFLMQYGKSLSMSGRHDEAIRILERSKKYLNNTVIQIALGDSYKAKNMISQSAIAYQKASLMTPARVLPYYLMMKLYMESGLENNAIEIAKKGLKIPVKIQSKANDQIRSEMSALIKIM